MTAIDQQSLDGGSWLIAQEVLLEPLPPLSSFTARRVQQPDPLESFHSTLLGPRVADLLLHRVKETWMRNGSSEKLDTVTRRVPGMMVALLPVTAKVERKERKENLRSLRKAALPGARGLEGLVLSFRAQCAVKPSPSMRPPAFDPFLPLLIAVTIWGAVLRWGLLLSAGLACPSSRPSGCTIGF